MGEKPATNSAPGAFCDDATSHVRNISATSAALSEWVRWLRLPPISGLECAQALRGDGFRLLAKVPGCIELHRDATLIQVPLAERLTPDVLIAILLRAGVGPARFLHLLESDKAR